MIAGCGNVPAEDIHMRCSVDGDAIIVEPVYSDAHALGLLGEHLLVSWEVSPASPWPWTARWHDARTLAPISEPIDLGYGPSARPTWVANAGAMEGYMLADIEHRPPAERAPQDAVTWWTHRPPPAAESVPLPIVMPDHDVRWSTAGLILGGWPGVYPSVGMGGAVVGILPTIPAACSGDEVILQSFRLHRFSLDAPLAQPLLWGDACTRGADHSDEMLVPAVVQLPDGFGVFHRFDGPVPQRLRYATTDDAGVPRGRPRYVGLTTEFSPTVTMDGGFQARAVSLGNVVLFTEGRRRADRCHALRMMDPDGSDVRSAPWQPPCTSTSHVFVHPIEMGRSGDYAVLLWAERSANQMDGESEALRVTEDVEWWADVKLALITSEGRLASEPVSIIESQSTPLAPVPRTADFGPTPAGFRISLAVDASAAQPEAVVAWTDRREDAPGLYARRVRCEPLTGSE